MNIPVIDGSNYFKGLLLLTRKDNKISESEHLLMMRIGKALGFDEKFTENAIEEILGNRFISESPPVFSSKELAEKFLKDGLVLATSDKEIHRHEEEWLLSVAGINNIDASWYYKEKKSLLRIKYNAIPLSADDLEVLY